MDIGNFLDRAAVAPRLSAGDKRHALQLAAEVATRGLAVPAGPVFEALSAREAVSSTGVGQGVAVPHAHVPQLQRVRGAFLKLDHPIDFDALDDQPVDLIFVLLSPEGAAPEHLRALARVTRLLRNASVRDQLRRARTVDALHALLAQEAHASAA